MSYVKKTPLNEAQRRDQIKSQETTIALNDIRLAIHNEINQRLNDDGLLRQDISSLQEIINGEIGDRTSADANIWTTLASDTATLTASDTFIINLLSSETALREVAEGQLRNEFNSAVDKETSARMLADENLRTAILATIGDDKAAQAITDEKLRNQIASETALRNAAFHSLQLALNSETAIRTAEDSRILGALSNEIINRQNADDSLNATLSAAISNETTSRNAAINTLRSEINSTLADNLNDFTKSKHGLVPVPPSGTTEQILTQNGWRPVTSSTIFINDFPSQFGSLIFNNNIQAPTFLNYDSAKLQISGTTSAKNAGNYIAKFTPKDLYVWGADNTQSTKDVGWSIQVLSLPKPAASQADFDYSGSNINLPVNNFNATYINQSGTVTASEPGSYSVTYSLKNTSNTKWEDGSTGNVTINWQIAKRDLTDEQSGPFEQSAALTFNGQLQTVTISNFDANYHTLAGTFQSTNAGNFTATVSPKQGYSWSDGSNAAKNVNWSISPAIVAKPYADIVSFDFDGNSKNLQVTNYDSSLMKQTGTLSATNAADYSVTYSLKDKKNYTWTDGSTDDVTINWAIGSKRLNKPSASTTTFTYSGSSKNLVVSNFDPEFMTEDGVKIAIDAGAYSVTYSLKDPAAAKWADGSTSNVTINWSINRKPLTATQSNLTLETDTFIYNFEAQTIKIINYDANYHDLTGVITETQSSQQVNYTAKVAPKSNYCWNDGSTSIKTFPWQIIPLTLGEISIQNQIYDGTSKSVQYLIDGKIPERSYVKTYPSEMTRINAGTYQVETALTDNRNLRFADGTYAHQSFDWTIERKPLTASQSTFAQDGSLTYNAAQQSPSFPSFNSSFHVLSGTTSAIDAGNYEAQVDLNSNYSWSDGSSDTKFVPWSINQKSVDIPTAAITDFTFDGEPHSPDISNFDASFVQKSGDQSATDAGSYRLIFALKDNVNTKWADGSIKDVVIEWAIGMTKISVPIPDNLIFTYNGDEQAPTFTGYDSDSMTIDGTLAATNAGNYSIIFNLKDNTKTIWENNSTGAKSFRWKINRKPLTVAQSTFAQSVPLTFNAKTQTVTISNYDENYHTISGNRASGAGNYTAHIKPNGNYCWFDGSASYKTVPWSINILKIAKPVINGDSVFTYDGKQHSLTVDNYAAPYMERRGTNAAANVGDYTITYALLAPNSCHWADDTTDKIYLAWSIAKRSFVKPTATKSVLTYDDSNGGTAQAPTIANFDPDFMNINGTIEAIDAGEYSITYSLKDKRLHIWADGSTDDVTINWTIQRYRSLPLPERIRFVNATPTGGNISEEITYSGNEIDLNALYGGTPRLFRYIRICRDSGALEPISSTYLTIGGTTSATNVGSYSLTLTPTSNYAWQDGSFDTQSFDWSIVPAKLPAVSIDENLTYNGIEQAPTILNFDENSMTIDGYLSATNAGYYRIQITPKDNFTWEDGSTKTVTLGWRILRQPLSPEFSNITTSIVKNYTGQRILVSPSECGVNTTYLDFLSQDPAFNSCDVGYYEKVRVSPKSNYCWFDGSTAYISIYLTIRDPDEDSSTGVRLPLITSDSVFTYDGSAKSISVDYNSNFSKVKTGYLSATDAGDYSVTYSLTNGASAWKDGTSTDKILSWKINRQPLTEKQSSFSPWNTPSYDGSVQTFTIIHFDSKYHEKGGIYAATNAGNYTATVTPKPNYCWSDGTFEPQNVNWTISKYAITRPIASSTSLSYNGESQSLPLNSSIDTDLVAISGSDTAVDVGSYSVTYSIRDTNNYKWKTGSGNVTINWKITPVRLDKPYAEQTEFTFTGDRIFLKVTGYDSKTMNTNDAEPSQYFEGAYVKTYSLKDKKNYTWTDGSTDDVIINWRITPITLTAAQSVVVQTKSITFDGKTHRPEFNNNAEYIGGQAEIAAQSDAGTYTATVQPVNGYVWNDGTKNPKTVEWTINKASRSYSLPDSFTASFSLDKIGTGNFSISSADPSICAVKVNNSTFTLVADKNGTTYITVTQAEDTNYFAYSDQFAVTINRSLADFTWTQIASFSKAGTLLDYCQIGDSKDVPINDITIGGTPIGGTFAATLIGYNHNPDYEGYNRAHFCLGKYGNVNVALVHLTEYGTITPRDGQHYAFTIGIADCVDTFNTTFLEALPTDLQAVITACKKGSKTYGGTHTRKIWFLDKYEIDGVNEKGMRPTEIVQQYDYFKNGNGLTRFKHIAIGTLATWWTRSWSGNYDNLMYVFNSSSGNFEKVDYNYSYGLVPCFTIS